MYQKAQILEHFKGILEHFKGIMCTFFLLFIVLFDQWTEIIHKILAVFL